MAKNSFGIMDSDIHVVEPPDLWMRYIEPRFRDRAPQVKAPRGEGFGQSGWYFENKIFSAYIDRPERQRAAQVRREKAEIRHVKIGRYQSAEEQDHRTAGGNPNAMLKAMDVEGVDIGITFRTQAAHLIAIDGLDPELSAAVCRAFNQWLFDFCRTDAKRLKVGAQMPIQSVTLAVQEARRAVEELGAAALVLPSYFVNGKPWYDRDYDPLWAEAERLNVPVAFHGIHLSYQSGHLGQRYMDNFAMTHSVGHGLELMQALGCMLTGGVFERFPGLRAAFLEGHCSWVPWWLWCLDGRVEKFHDNERFPLKAKPSEYFRRHCFVSVDPDEETVEQTVQAIGDENLVFSTDWPHDDSEYPHSVSTFLGLKGLSEQSKRKILWDNCARLYGFN